MNRSLLTGPNNETMTRGWRSLFLPRVTKQSLHVYGSEAAVQKECDRQRETSSWVIHPFSAIRNYYILLMLVLTFLNLLAIPIGIAFLDSEHHFRAWEIFNLFSDTVFVLDILVNFRMGVITDQKVILQPKEIRHHYLKSWFALDLISAFPLDYIILIAKSFEEHSDTSSFSASKLVRVIMFARIFSLARLLRVSKLWRFFTEWEQVSNANMEAVRLILRIMGLFLMILLLCHWNGCIQFLVPVLQEFPEHSWVVRENLTNATLGEQYSVAVFRALSHMIGISYGSAEPPSDETELWIVMTSMVSGALMYTMMVASIAAMMTNGDAPAKAFRSKMSQLEDYMTYRKLPRELRTRICNYFQARHQGKWFDEEDIFKLVSRPLREEILNVRCANVLNSVPMFRNRDANFSNAVLLKLRREVFQEGDLITHPNAPGDRMFFVERGRVLVTTATVQAELCDGDCFGELCLLNKGHCTAMVQATSLVRLYSLSAGSFEEVLQGFPEIREELYQTAHERLRV
ncbi:potassium/sodium hyperpolarization-activated cyclic nucleotide-gated channel 1 [Amia ocellicauda]|uniref:potassium/sodium hyperpolarization-activated cyclic nucleotide-gated channel 1 n=2 Tax=Amia ocellicauda TaxID=2972642 RepID=UPI003464E8DC